MTTAATTMHGALEDADQGHLHLHLCLIAARISPLHSRIQSNSQFRFLLTLRTNRV